MAHKSSQSSPKNKNENTSDTKKCIKEDNKAQNSQVVKKRGKAGKKNRKNKAGPAPCQSIRTGPTNSQVYSTSSLIPAPYVPTMATYYPQSYSHPFHIDWSPIMAAIQVPTPVYTVPFQPMPMLVNPIVTTICPYTVLSPQMITPMATATVVTEIPVPCNTELPQIQYTDQSNITIQTNTTITLADETYYESSENVVGCAEYSKEINTTTEDSTQAIQETPNEEIITQNKITDPLAIYLSLPKHLFPPPRMLTIDPNPLIDEFCKLYNVHSHEPWLLDLEFGIRKSPIARKIPIYNVNFNSIHCKNTPNAIHPGFDSCNEEFKSVFLFYYDCMVSSLYTGYVMYHCDASVDNFQAWLLIPMQELGMCWL